MAEKMEVLRGLVEEVVVGYRPSREGGPRVERGSDIDLEIDDIQNSDFDLDTQGAGKKSARKMEKCKVKVFYNYGHGGAGWQACWGAAEETRDLVLAAEGN
jgi:glycine/D-amino acid oxidase-like deaminating enzyme